MKFYTVEKEINGVKYKAQFNGISQALKCVDETYIEGTGVTSTEKLAQYIFDHVIVEPKVTIDDFETVEEMKAVLKFGQEVMNGKFRNEVVENGVKAKSGK